MNAQVHKRACVAHLTTYCEQIIQRGQLPAADELKIRELVNATCDAFEMVKVLEDGNSAS